MTPTATVPLKFIGRIVSGGTPKADARNWNGELPFITPPDLNGLDGAVLHDWERSLTELGRVQSAVVTNAVMLSCRAPIGHIGAATREVAFNQGCKAIVPDRVEDLRYLAHCLVAHRKALQAAGRGTTFTELSTTELAAFRIPWPGQDERWRIADYLHRETAEIDAMMGKMDELAATLVARRDAVIARAFSADFSRLTTTVQTIADVTVGIVIEPSKLYVPIGAGVPALRGLNVSAGKIRSADMVEISSEGHASHQKSSLREGDLVTVRTGQAGVTAVIPAEWHGANAIDLVITRPHAGLSPQYLYWFLCSPFAKDQMSAETVGAVQAHFNVGALKRLRIPVVERDEQASIAAHLDGMTGKIDQMLAKVAELKALLIERRAALITDVITGKKAVA